MRFNLIPAVLALIAATTIAMPNAMRRIEPQAEALKPRHLHGDPNLQPRYNSYLPYGPGTEYGSSGHHSHR